MEQKNTPSSNETHQEPTEVLQKKSPEQDQDRRRLNEILKSISQLNKGLQDFVNSLPKKSDH